MNRVSPFDTVNEKGDRSIRPPQLSLILRDNNVLQLEEQQIQDALEKSREYWYQIANLAFQLRDTGLIPEFTNPRFALHRTPKLQAQSERLHIRPYGMTPILSLCCEASSIWTLSGDQDCGKLKKQK
ncbi:hypothetical protein ACMYSQ_002074 [Aspergillus niger]